MWEDRKWSATYGILSLYYGRKDGRLGRWAIDLQTPEFPGNADNQSSFGGTLCQTIIADKDCSIWPILASTAGTRKWIKIGNSDP